MADPFLAWLDAGRREQLAMWEFEHGCISCGRRDVWSPALAPQPFCRCGREMVTLPPSRLATLGV